MKTLSFTFFIALICSIGYAQKTKPDSLKQALKIATTDSARNNIYVELLSYYNEVNRDSALFYAEKRLSLAKQNNYKTAEATTLTAKGYQYANMGSYAASYQNLLLALRIAEDPNNEEKNGWRLTQFPIKGKERLNILAGIHFNLGMLMRNTENTKQEIFHEKESLKIGSQINHKERQMLANMFLAYTYSKNNQLDSAFYFAQ